MMAKLNHTAGVEQVPFHSCSTSAEAISLLSMSLQTAIQATCYIHIPLPGELALLMLAVLLTHRARHHACL